MSKHKVKIVATSAEEFINIEEKLAMLPAVIYEQINEARNHLIGLECHIKDLFGDRTLYLPNTVKQQSLIGEQVNIYCGGKGDTEYRFVLPVSMSEKPVAFQLIDMPTKEVEREAQKVRIEYDQQPNEVADSFSSALSKIGITVTELDGGDGYNEYEIK